MTAYNNDLLFVYDFEEIEGNEDLSYLEPILGCLGEDAIARLLTIDADVYNRLITCNAEREILGPGIRRDILND
jgi:hypothetical protein